MSERKRVGRPLKPAKPGQKSTISVVVPPTLKQRLSEACAGNARSLSEEAEHRLQQSFEQDRIIKWMETHLDRGI